MLKKLRLRQKNGFLKKMKTCSGPVILSRLCCTTYVEITTEKLFYQITMNENEFQNFQIKNKRIEPSGKNLLSSFEESSSVLNLSTLSASSLVPYSRSVSTTSYVVQFFSGAAHDAMYWPTVFLPLSDQETTPKKSSTQGQGTTAFTSLSCSVITFTEYNLRKRGARHVAITP